MPTFRHSKVSRLAVGAYDASAVTDDIETKHAVDTAEVTAHTDSDKAYLAGHVATEVSLAGHVDGSTVKVDANAVRATLGSTAPVITSFCPEGYTVGNNAQLVYGVAKQYDVKSPSQDAVEFAASFVVGGTGSARVAKQAKAEQGIVLLHSTALSTSTAASASQDGTLASTRGYIAHLHGFGGTIGSTKVVDIEVQHSSAGVAWADLTSFTAINTAGVYLGSARVFSTSAAVKRYVRGAVTTQSSTGTPLALLTFVRR